MSKEEKKETAPVEKTAAKTPVKGSPKGPAQAKGSKDKKQPPKEAPQQNKSSSKRGSWLSGTIALLALAAVIAASAVGYLEWAKITATLQQMQNKLNAVQTNQDQTQSQAAQLQSTSDRVDTLADTQKRLENAANQRIGAVETAINQSQSHLAQLQTLLETTGQQTENQSRFKQAIEQQIAEIKIALSGLYQGANQNSTDQSLTEIEYLMRNAQLHLHYRGDTNKAIRALKMADQQFQTINDMRFGLIRSQIAVVINTLEQINAPDIEQLSSRLSNVIDEIENLSLSSAESSDTKKEKANMAEQQNEDGLSIQRVLGDLWQGLRSMVVLRHHDDPIDHKHLQQRATLKPNLVLMLETARLALLSNQQALYSESLKEAGRFLDRHFNQENDTAKAMAKEIHELQAIPISPDLPDISGLLKLLQQSRSKVN